MWAEGYFQGMIDITGNDCYKNIDKLNDSRMAHMWNLEIFLALETSHDFFVLAVVPRYLELFLGTGFRKFISKNPQLLRTYRIRLPLPSATVGITGHNVVGITLVVSHRWSTFNSRWRVLEIGVVKGGGFRAVRGQVHNARLRNPTSLTTRRRWTWTIPQQISQMCLEKR